MNRMRPLIAGLATTVLVSGGLGLAGLGLGAGTAQAGTPGTNTWCPGQPMPQPAAGQPPLTWDMSVCHDWYAGWPDRNPTEGEYPIQLGSGL
jgi:hypothetical protein